MHITGAPSHRFALGSVVGSSRLRAWTIGFCGGENSHSIYVRAISEYRGRCTSFPCTPLTHLPLFRISTRRVFTHSYTDFGGSVGIPSPCFSGELR